MSKKIVVRSQDGKHIVGIIEGKVFKKSIHSSKHWVRRYDAIGIEAQAVEESILPICGLSGLIEIWDKDSGTTYRATIKDFLLHSIVDDLGGGAGEHYFLPAQYWTILPSNQQALKLQ